MKIHYSTKYNHKTNYRMKYRCIIVSIAGMLDLQKQSRSIAW